MDKKIQYCNPEIWGGIECTINRVRDEFFDQLEYIDHYKRAGDIELIGEIGFKKFRYPILWEKHQPSIDTAIDWSYTKKRLEELRSKKIDVIAGLVHHGSGPSFTNLLDDNFPELLAAYAKQVAQQFPWIEYYTPVNEPLTTARFSALYGFWYPHKKNEKSFFKALINELKGTVLSMQEIRKINPEAKLVQTEDLGKTYSTPKLRYQAEFENERRWLTFDLLCGRVDQQHALWRHLIDSGITEDQLKFFINNPCIPDIAGFNHYLTSERFLDDRIELYPEGMHGGNGRDKYVDVEAVRVKLQEEIGIEILLEEAWERFRLPIAVTEVHLHCHREEQLRWFEYVWNACKTLTSKGIPVKAVTAWAVLGSKGWDKLLTEPNGTYEPGVFDLHNGVPRPTALTGYLKQLIKSQRCNSQLLKAKGWWQRDGRIIYNHFPYEVKLKPITLNPAKPILILGKTGTLGKAFSRICKERFIHHQLLNRGDCDISNPATIEAAIKLYKPWAIVNTAGYVRVDDAEKEKEKCFLANTTGAHNLAKICSDKKIKLVSFSSDLVFDGEKNEPYVESDPVNPLNVYGLSKAEAEKLISEVNTDALIIRTSAFFGPWDEYNFVHWVMHNLNLKLTVTAANDVLISPTYVPDLVHATLDLLIDDEKGIWHLANKGSLTWADLAYQTAAAFNSDASLINAIPVNEMNLSATRPVYGVLGSERGHLLPSLDNALQRFFDEKRVAVNL